MKNSILISGLHFLVLLFIPYSVHGQGIYIGGGGNMIITGGANIQIKDGNFINDGTYTKGTETVSFSGTTAQTISGASTINMNNLSVTNTGGLTTQLTLLTAANLSISSGSKFTIPAGKAVTVSTALTNNSGSAAGLVVESGVASNGSLIQPTTGVSATVQRYLTKGVWHVISIPVSGQPIGSFVSDVNNYIGYNATTTDWGMMPYDPANNNWASYFRTATAGNLKVGEGYMIRRKTSVPTGGIVTATGALQAGNFTVTGLTAGKWNCIGNPFTSAVSVTTESALASDFLNTNAALLDGIYGAIYVWDEKTDYTGPLRSDYKVISNNGYNPSLAKTDLQVGQGFLVKMAFDATTLNFTSAMQSHLVTETYLKKSASSWPGFDLVATSSDLSINTIVSFNEAMTAGLDPTYDAGVLKGNPKLALYTRLVEDNGTGFSIQCLPLIGIDVFVIPVGIDFPSGGEISFTAKAELIPPGSTVILEDRMNGTFTNLVTNQAGYTVSLPASASGTGRFFLHLNNNQVNNPTFEKEPVQVYAAANKIYINGQIPEVTAIYLYSIQGVLKRTYSPQTSEKLQLDADGLNGGIYLLKIRDKMGVKTYKLNIGLDL